MPHPKPTDLNMTKHSDYFVWKDTSKRVARRCDDTVDEKRMNSCVLKHLFLEGFEQPKISPKNPRNALSDALLISRFQNFAADATKKKPRSAQFFKTALRVVLMNEFSRINSGPKILRSYFLHWVQVHMGKLDIISDGLIHYQMLRFCQNTRLAFLGRNTPTPLPSYLTSLQK